MRGSRRMAGGMLLAALAACGDGGTDNMVAPVGRNAAAPAEAPAPPTPPTPPEVRVGASVVREAADDYTFEYSFPAPAAAIPALAERLDAMRREARAELVRGAAEDRRSADESDRPFRQHEAKTEWLVVADTPRFLSLSSTAYVFTGGAHGMTGYDALLWDRADTAVRAPRDLFRSPAALEAAIRPATCRLLDAARERRRGGAVERGGPFADCPALSEATILLGSSTGRAFDRIGVVFGPYVAGPYAEGAYDLTVPVTPAVIEAVEPRFQPAFVPA